VSHSGHLYGAEQLNKWGRQWKTYSQQQLASGLLWKNRAQYEKKSANSKVAL
jgi:hypothetical protein